MQTLFYMVQPKPCLTSTLPKLQLSESFTSSEGFNPNLQSLQLDSKVLVDPHKSSQMINLN